MDVEESKAAVKKRYGYSVRVANESTATMTTGELCYQDGSRQTMAPAAVQVVGQCKLGARYVFLYNNRSLGGTEDYMSPWPNLQLTEVQVLADTGK